MERKFYGVKFTESAEKDLKKINKSNKAIAKLLKKWISENLIGTQNPKQRGKALTGNLKGLWRYRVGSYRIIAEIKNDILLILIIEISDRKKIYKDKKRKTYKDEKIKEIYRIEKRYIQIKKDIGPFLFVYYKLLLYIIIEY